MELKDTETKKIPIKRRVSLILNGIESQSQENWLLLFCCTLILNGIESP